MFFHTMKLRNQNFKIYNDGYKILFSKKNNRFEDSRVYLELEP